MSRLFFVNAGCDARWTWRGTLPQRLADLIAELPWHFVLAAGADDAIYLPKPWPKACPLPHETLGLAPPALLTGNPRSTWWRRHPDYAPFAWDRDAVTWMRRHAQRTPGSPDPSPAADAETVARLNGRRFSLALEQELGEAAGWHASDGAVLAPGDSVHAVLKARGWPKGMLKGEHGQSGSANLPVEALPPGTDALLDFRIARLLNRCGHAVLEPWHAIREEFGYAYGLTPEGAIADPRGHRLLTTSQGSYLGVQVAPGGALPPDIGAAFAGAAAAVASRLHRAGYHGPVGQDGYVHAVTGADGSTSLIFRPLSDLNVRMTLATPAHALSRALGDRHLLLILCSTAALPPSSPGLDRDAVWGPLRYSRARRTGVFWASPAVDGDGRPALRQGLVLVAEEAEALRSLAEAVFAVMPELQHG